MAEKDPTLLMQPAKTESPAPMPRTKPEEDQTVKVAKAVAKEIVKETAAATGLYRRSSEPFEADNPYNKKNYDLLAEADKIAVAMGHNLSKWVAVEKNATDVAAPGEMWHARCMTCGWTGFARWAGKTQNSQHDDSTFPVIGGEIMSATCAKLSKAEERRTRQQFSARTE